MMYEQKISNRYIKCSLMVDYGFHFLTENLHRKISPMSASHFILSLTAFLKQHEIYFLEQ